MKKTLLTVVAGAALFAACSADETDFKDTAEETIEKEGKRQADLELEATCEEPDSTKVGTVFSCTATDADGLEYNFSAEITDDDEVTVSQV